MKADTVDLAAIFGKPVRYMVPLFQRPYVWTLEEQWEPLWQDVRTVADRQLDDNPTNDTIPHFMGAVVLEQALVGSGMIETRSIIDGQQRLTTLQLVLAAARSVAADHSLDQSRQMFEKLLFNEMFLVKSDADRMKVLPTDRDRTAFRESIQDGAASATGAHRIHEAYRYFRKSISDWVLEARSGDARREDDRAQHRLVEAARRRDHRPRPRRQRPDHLRDAERPRHPAAGRGPHQEPPVPDGDHPGRGHRQALRGALADAR